LALALTACVKPVGPVLQVNLTEGDRTRAEDAARPDLPPLAPLHATPAEERAYLWRTYVAPLMSFSLQQEATVAAERQRADGVVAKVDAHKEVSQPKREWWRVW
jgi:hypothetical protein